MYIIVLLFQLLAELFGPTKYNPVFMIVSLSSCYQDLFTCDYF